jgi:predicted GIY-YIG superfamily endonuclease
MRHGKSGVYLIHFERPHRHAGHYIGWSGDIEARLDCHRAGTGARLLRVLEGEGIGWKVALVWEGRGRSFERRLKKRKPPWRSVAEFCPECRRLQGK